ncbi:hypothetical protein ANAPRD1_01204 [Anaplasma phagocytophilum]|nr:hypothetical protein ANAPRD1_01204 [Anaplasma phagocytophilum]
MRLRRESFSYKVFDKDIPLSKDVGISHLSLDNKVYETENYQSPSSLTTYRIYAANTSTKRHNNSYY